jgi:hypothetical protein
VRENLGGEQLHAVQYALMWDHAEEVEPADHPAWGELAVDLCDSLDAAVWRVEDSDAGLIPTGRSN